MLHLLIPLFFSIVDREVNAGQDVGLVKNGKERVTHEPINYIDTKAKCRHKKLTCKGSLRQIFIKDTVSHVVIYDPAL